jgi:hypothetical protein
MGSGDILASDVRALTKKLEAIQPGLRAELMREAKSIGAKADNSIIKPAIQGIVPLSGSLKPGNTGRLAWNYQVAKVGKSLQRVSADKTQVQFRTGMTKDARLAGITTTSLVNVRVIAPMVIISDIAGRSNRQTGKGYKGSGYSREFDRNGIMVRVRQNGQGQGMIRNLGSGASRYLWPAMIQKKPQLESEIRAVLQRYEQIAARGFN